LGLCFARQKSSIGIILSGDLMKNIKEKTGVIMKAVDEKDDEKALKIIIGGTLVLSHVLNKFGIVIF
jgi:hypothetical protein